MSLRLSGLNPLAYMGVEPLSPALFVINTVSPTVNDWQNFNLGTVWLNTTNQVPYMLVSLANNQATWISLAQNTPLDDLVIETESGNASPNASNVLNFTAGVNLATTGSGNTFKVSLAGLTPYSLLAGSTTGTFITSLGAATNGQIPIGNTGTYPTLATLTPGANITITNGPGSITIGSESGSTGASSFPTDIGTATESGGVLNVHGTSNLITTLGSGDTITIDVGGGVATTFETDDSNTAVPLSNEIVVAGGTGIETSSSGNTITITNTGSGGSSTLTTFTTSGTWTKQANTHFVTVLGWGGGGGGGSGARGLNSGQGGNGGSPSGSFYWFGPVSFFGSSATVTIGSGGSGGAAVTTNNTAGNNGTAGSSSAFGAIAPLGSTSNNYGTGGGNLFTGTPSSSGLFFNAANALETYGSSANRGLVAATILGQPTVTTSSFYTGGLGGPASGGTIGGPATTGANIGGYASGTSSSGYSYKYFVPTAGGGGGGAASQIVGAAGGTVYGLDGATVLTAGGTGGASAGSNGGAGNTPPSAPTGTQGGFIYGGTGGGGGAGNGSGTGGTGGAGGAPGGGGGGGGGSANGNNSGAGGNGANGKVIVIEW